MKRLFGTVILALSTAMLLSACGGSGGGTDPAPTYNVTYNGNGNTGGSVPVDSTSYKQGQTVIVLGNTGNLVMSGNSFSGWNTRADGSGTTYDQGQTFTMGSANTTLYAKWTPHPTYTVTYNGNGSSGGSVPVDSAHYEQGQIVTVLGNTGNLVMAGHAFSGWNTQANGSGTTYAQGQTFTMGSANSTLYAMWALVPICNAPGNQYGVRLIKAVGGYIVAWQDERRVSRDIYAQKVDADGTAKWAANGRVIAAGNNGEASNNLLHNSQSLTGMASDTQGGAIVLWTEDYSCSSGPCGHGWITRVDSNGNVQWGAPPSPGVAIQGTDTAVSLGQPAHADAIAPDGQGGAFAIEDYDAWGSWNVFRLDSSGAFRSITSAMIGQRAASQMIYGGSANGKDYVSIAWWDVYSGGDFAINIEDPEVNYPASTDTLYAPWSKSTLTSTPAWWSEPSVVPDSAGGMIVAWEDSRNGNSDVFAQRIRADGSALWPPNGVAVAVQSGDQRFPQLVSDGTGGAVIVWQDQRDTSATRIYAQHVRADGSTTWAANGILVSSTYGESPKVVGSEDGGSIVVWVDSDHNGGTPDYLRAQKIDTNGVLLWPPDSRTQSGGTTGTVVSEIYGADFDIVSDGSSGLIVVWNLAGDVWLRRVMSDGTVR